MIGGIEIVDIQHTIMGIDMDTSKTSSIRFALFFTLLAALFTFAHVRLAWTDGDEGRYLAISSSIAKGLGQVEEYFPEPQPETITPSGYVWYLAGWIRAFGQQHLTWIRLSSVIPFILFVSCFSVLVLQRVRRAGDGLFVAGCLVVFGAFQVQLLRYAWNLMSETCFLFLTYLFFAVQERREDSDVGLGRAAVLGIVAACATLVRPLGIAFPLAAGIHFLFHRRWKPLLVFSAVFAFAYAPQIIRTWCILGVPFAHMTHYHAAGSPLQSIIAMVSTTANGWIGYFFRDLPADLFFYLFGGGGFLARVGLSGLSIPLGWLVSGVVAVGFLRRIPHFRVAEWFWCFYWFLFCSYNEITGLVGPGNFHFQPRYLAPVLPLAALYFASGIDWLARTAACGWKGAFRLRNATFAGVAAYALLVSMAVGAICLKNTWRFRGQKAWSYERLASSKNADDLALARYAEAAEWASANLPSNALIASRKPQQTLVFSGLKGFRYDFDWRDSANRDVWLNALSYGQYGPVYLLQDAFPATSGYGNTRVQLLDPAIAAHAADLHLVYETEEPVTRLWLVIPTSPEQTAPPLPPPAP